MRHGPPGGLVPARGLERVRRQDFYRAYEAYTGARDELEQLEQEVADERDEALAAVRERINESCRAFLVAHPEATAAREAAAGGGAGGGAAVDPDVEREAKRVRLAVRAENNLRERARLGAILAQQQEAKFRPAGSGTPPDGGSGAGPADPADPALGGAGA